MSKYILHLKIFEKPYQFYFIRQLHKKFPCSYFVMTQKNEYKVLSHVIKYRFFIVCEPLSVICYINMVQLDHLILNVLKSFER